MRWNKMKAVLAGAILAVSVAVTGMNAQAATIDSGKSIYYVGEQVNITGADVKINKKATSKSKKKIKTVKTAQNSQNSRYRTKAYFEKDSELYASSNAYNAEHGSQVYKYRPATASYELTFLKAGTYTISYVTYELESYDTASARKYDEKTDTTEYVRDAAGNIIYNITKYNYSTGQDDVVTSYTEVEAGVKAVESFYQGTNGKIYAYGDNGLVPATLATAADGKVHVKYQPLKLEKITHTTTYRVLAKSGAVKSIKLGKSIATGTTTYKEGGKSYSSKRGKFLTGNSGKLIVTMGDKKTYALTSILVKTYDADGNAIYTKVGNKKNVVYGNNIYKYESSPEATNPYYYKSMYKETEVYVFYKNKFTGSSTTVDITKDAAGNNKCVIARKYLGKNYSTGKKNVTLTETYEITEKKPTTEYGSTTYNVKRTYQEFNRYANKYITKTEEKTRYSVDISEYFNYNYASSTFYKK